MHLFIVRSFIALFILLTISSCAITQQSEHTNSSCFEKRGAIDIGSGTSKLVVALVNTCQRTIDHVVFEAQRAIPFKEALQRNKKNLFNNDITAKAIKGLNELRFLATSQGAKKIRAVATSAFRTASNATETKSKIEKSVKFRIKVITQEDEALFGYNSAMSMAKTTGKITSKPIAVWDIGGGSMQIVKPSEGKEKTIYLGKLASVSFKNKLLKKFYKKKRKSPNPLGKKTAVNSMSMARDYATKDARPLLGQLKGHQVLGVGGVHYYSVRGQLGKKKYNQTNLLKTLLKRAKLNDKKIDSKYAATDVTNLALVLGYMQALSINEVTPLKINMAHGVLTTESLW